MISQFYRKHVSLIVATILLALLATGLNAANRVLIKAVANDEFTRSRALDKNKEILYYQFMEGRYYQGNTRNPGMEKFTFRDIIENMAVHLAEQDFYPNPDPKLTDLLIVVHYGVTNYEQTYQEMMGYVTAEDMGYTQEVANAGAGGVGLTASEMNAIADFNFQMTISESIGRDNENSNYVEAQLLGMEEAYSPDVSTTDEYALKTMLNEERYFVVLMAYDFQPMLQGELKLLWSTRYSIRAVGQSFANAIKDMNQVAEDFFGKNTNGLQKKRVTDKSRVEIGEIEVIGEEKE